MSEHDPCCDAQHPDHKEELSRLNRINGQVNGVKKMIDERRYCPDILVQLRAARSAIKSVEANILERHLDGCVSDVMASDDEQAQEIKLAEIKEIFKGYLK